MSARRGRLHGMPTSQPHREKSQLREQLDLRQGRLVMEAGDAYDPVDVNAGQRAHLAAAQRMSQRATSLTNAAGRSHNPIRRFRLLADARRCWAAHSLHMTDAKLLQTAFGVQATGN